MKWLANHKKIMLIITESCNLRCSQLLSEADGRSAHPKMKIHSIANKFA